MGHKHNYPKVRKERDTFKSLTQIVLSHIGKENLYEIWKESGHAQCAKIVSGILHIYVDRMVIHYIAMKKLGWKRVISDKNNPLYKSVLSGKVDPAHYKTIIFI